MMYLRNTTHGFTLVEILVVIAILFIIGAFTTIAFQNMYIAAALRTSADEVRASLTDARTRTLASENDMVFGVRVGTSSVTRFNGSLFNPGDATNKVFVFEGGVSATGTLVTGERDIVFTRLTGTPSAAGEIYVVNRDGDATTTITIHPSGLIE